MEFDIYDLLNECRNKGARHILHKYLCNKSFVLVENMSDLVYDCYHGFVDCTKEEMQALEKVLEYMIEEEKYAADYEEDKRDAARAYFGY